MMRKRTTIDLTTLQDDQIEAMRKSLDVGAKEFPSLFIGLNVAEFRAIKTIYTKQHNRFPDMVSVEFANGVGKTTLMVLDMIGWTMGPEYLNENGYPDNAVAFWQSLSHLRDNAQLSMRIVCSAQDMKAGGSVYDCLKKVFPWAKPNKQDNTGCFKQIDIPHPKIPYVTNHIAVLTFDQEPEKHAGPTLDRIWVNENLPENLWPETNARTRGGGNIVQFATILDHSTHLNELENGESFILERCRGHVYENCIGEEVTDDMALEVAREIGHDLERNPAGPGYVTGGTLSIAKINAMIEGWTRANPEELEARKTGKPVGEGGKIHPAYNDDVHKIRDDSYGDVPTDWPMAMLCDPHPARPDAVIWVQMLSSDRLAIVDEWPTFKEYGYYDKIKECRLPYKQKCDIWREFEAERGYLERIGDNRIGDPNRFREPDVDSYGTLADLYAAQGFRFNLEINDGFEYGVALVNQYLWYDANIRRLNPNDPAGKPRIVIYDRCMNVRRALANFARKKNPDKTKPVSEIVDKRFECFCALVRYLVVWHQSHHFSEMKIDSNRVSDYELIRRGRLPKGMRPYSPGVFNDHGRKIISTARFQ